SMNEQGHYPPPDFGCPPPNTIQHFQQKPHASSFHPGMWSWGETSSEPPRDYSGQAGWHHGTTQKNKKEPEYSHFCDTCDRGFKHQEKYEEHVSQHVTCSVPDCSFMAHEKLVTIHWKNNHAPGAKRIKLDTLDEITKWREARRKNYPTLQNMDKKKKVMEVREETGAVLETLLAPDIRHERNVLLQCVRYVVRNNFFGLESRPEDQRGVKDKVPPAISAGERAGRPERSSDKATSWFPSLVGAQRSSAEVIYLEELETGNAVLVDQYLHTRSEPSQVPPADSAASAEPVTGHFIQNAEETTVKDGLCLTGTDEIRSTSYTYDDEVWESPDSVMSEQITELD
uniref:C2H2-type domain-containing protein n=1 Tax=Cyclopterus lumpus TaxID=8103 RepID=A0A8C2XM03_CYCLU